MINEKKKHRSYIPAKDIKGYDEKIYPQAFLRNKKLMDLVKSKTDPISFLLAVVKMQNAGKTSPSEDRGCNYQRGGSPME